MPTAPDEDPAATGLPSDRQPADELRSGPWVAGSRAQPPASRAAAQVADFHRAYELPLRQSPSAEVGAAQVQLRQALIEEEVAELAAAGAAGDLVGVADALADIVYVAYGTAHVYGIDLDAVLNAVHVSNMTKLGADGRPIRRADGKILKGPDYRPPEIAAILHRIIEEAASADTATNGQHRQPGRD